MKYIISIGMLLFLIFISLLIITWSINNKVVSKKIFIALSNTINTIPKILFIGGILFIFFQTMFNIIDIKEYYLDVFIVSLYGVIIIFVGEYISGVILRKLSHVCCKRYSNINLTNEEMISIYKKNKKSIILWHYILSFIICAILYSIVIEFILSQNTLLITVLMTLISVVGYWIFFKKIII